MSRNCISQNGQSRDKELKEYVAAHPELFRRIGRFVRGTTEAPLPSGDEVDVLFSNDDTILAVEVKTEEAPLNELTRGLYQCVKYRAVLRARNAVENTPRNVRVVLVTPQTLPPNHENAAKRLRVEWKRIEAYGRNSA